MAESTINITRKKQGDVMVLELHGALDARTTPRLNAELKGVISAGNVKVVCDLSNLRYIASAGIGALFANLKEAKKGGGDLRLAGASKEIQDVFDLLNFSAAFKMAPTVAEALRGF